MSLLKQFATATVFPVLACALQLWFWPYLHPLVWFLFYPAVFLASQFVGLFACLWATLLSSGLAWLIFFPKLAASATAGEAIASPYISLTGFMLMGGLFSLISHRRRHGMAARAQRQGDQNLMQILDESADGMMVAHPDGRLSYANPQICHMLGYSAAQLCQMQVAEIVPPDALEQAIRDFNTTRMQGHWRGEAVLQAQDGHTLEVEINAVALSDGRLFATLRDISELKRMLETLHESETKFRTLFEGSNDAIVLYANGRFIDCNPQAVQLYGVADKSALLKLHPADLSPPVQPDGRSSLAAANEHIEHAFATGSSCFEWMHRRWSGDDFPAEVSISTLVHCGQPVLQATVRDLTQQHRAAAELRKLSLAVEQNPASILITDLGGRIEYVNEAFVHISGYGRDEVLGKSPRLLASGKTPQATYKGLRQALQNGDTWKGQFINRRKDGSHYIEFAIISPIRRADGSVSHYLAIQEDITEKQRLGEELDRHRHHLEQLVAERTAELQLAYQQLLENQFAMNRVGIGITWVDSRTGRFLYCNRYIADLLGYAEEEMVGRHISLIAPGVSEDGFYQSTASLRREAPTQFESAYRTRDDQRIPVALSIYYFPGQTGTPDRFIAFITDITRRKAAEAVLEEHSKRISDLYDRAPCGYHSLDRNGLILDVNATELSMLGYARTEFIGCNLRDFMTPPSQTRFLAGFSELQMSGKVRDLEYELICKDGSILPVLVSADAVRDTQGRFLFSRATMVDNRERKTRERQIADMQSELARRAEAAEAATRSKSIFLANMSHEIRTPMNAILGLTHLLKQTAVTGEQSASLDKIRSAGKHLLGVINDILDLSKFEAGKLHLEELDFCLPELMDELHALMADTVRDKGLALIIEPLPDLGWLRGDPTRLRQALFNYVGNAVKFTAQGQISLRCKVLARNDEQIVLRFEVQDTGPGLTAAQLSRLFQAFEQADGSTTRQYGGTGLGLAITRRLAELMGGQAGACSEPGVGSRFWFTARLVPGNSANRTADAGEADLTLRLRQDHGACRILMAEDDPINQEVSLWLLRSVGLQAEVVENGAAALAHIQAGLPCDLILMDMQMPVMDGLDATAAIRRLPHGASLPILAMTANAYAEDRNRCLAAGMNDFVPKPVEPQHLFAALLRWLPVKPAPKVANVSDLADAAAEQAATALALAPAGLDSDLNQGLRRFGGQEEKFRDMLARFLIRHRDDMADLARLRAERLPEDARRLAHTLKGGAATLGLNRIQALARELEQALKTDGESVEQLCQSLELALAAAAERYGSSPASSSTPSEAPLRKPV